MKRKSQIIAGLFFSVVLSGPLCPGPAYAVPPGYVTIPGQVIPIPAGAHPLGAASSAEQINLSIALPLNNQAALEGLIKRLYDPTDPLFGQYLTPTVFAEAYSPTQAA